jgi:hypothetical protein
LACLYKTIPWFEVPKTNSFSNLKNNPKRYLVRYDDVRCMPLNKFPFLVHFSIEESIQTTSVRETEIILNFFLEKIQAGVLRLLLIR